MTQRSSRSIQDFAGAKVEQALDDARLDAAIEWLGSDAASGVETERRAHLWYRAGKLATAERRWGDAESCLVRANELSRAALYQKRLHLVRARKAPEINLQNRGTLPRPARLPATAFAPELKGVVACGQYHSRDSQRGTPWSRLLRDAKNPPADPAERLAALSISAACFCHVIQAETTFLRDVDVVVAIPPDPERYSRRGQSLPDELALAVEQYLSVPWVPAALERVKSVELRGLSKSERAAAVRDSMSSGGIGAFAPSCALLVDDVITHGSTLREAARVLREVGLSIIYGAALSHTEG